MNSTHLTNKLLAERARQRQEPSSTEAAPPPYSAMDEQSEGESDDDEPVMPAKLTINADHTIRGCNNLVPTTASPLADATKFSMILLQAISRINGIHTAAATSGANSAQPRQMIKVDLTINCGITIVGDRNVVGNVGLRVRTPTQDSSSAVVAGAKRKADDENNETLDGPAAKRTATWNE